MAYRLKTVRYQNSDRKILLQNENGPCPLLAAANALLLKGVISLPSESVRLGVASLEDVQNVLAERALEQSESSHHLQELLSELPRLQYGMDVNPKFTCGVTGVEYTSSLVAFDMLNVDLVHGWLLDPQDEHTHKLVGQKSYNELIEFVVQGNEACAETEVLSEKIVAIEGQLHELETQGESDWVNITAESSSPAQAAVDEGAALKVDPPTPDDETEKTKKTDAEHEVMEELNVDEANPTMEEDKEDASKKTHARTEKPAVVEADNSAEEFKPLEAKPQLSVEERKQTLEKELAELKNKRDTLATVSTNGSLINTFLSSTGHQLTHYGLHELYSHVKEDSLCVFFRNNHFATLTNHKGVLYLLVTDLGYADVPEVVWEKLDGIDGNTEYVNASFATPAPQTELKPAPGPSLNPEDVIAQRGQAEADFHLALQLSQHADPNPSIDDKEGELVAAATEASLRTFNGIEEEAPTETAAPVEATIATIPQSNGIIDGCSTQEDSDKLLAMQLQVQMNGSLPDENEDASLHLARQLQNQEREIAAARQRKANQRQAASTNANSSTSSNCIIS